MAVGIMRLLPVAGITVALLGSQAALADCVSTKRPYSLSGDTVVSADIVDGKSTCRHPLKAPPDKQLTGVSVVSPPKHGKLTEGGKYVIYTPAPGFKGDDSYTIKICGGDATSKGCSTITYNTTVN
jgi:Bacterial Ig domain